MDVAEPESDQSPALKFRILRAVPVLLVLGLLVHFLLPRLDTIGDSLATLRTLAPWAIGLSLVMEVLSYVANGALLQTIIHLAGERMSLRRAAAIEIGAGSEGLVAAGETASEIWEKMRGGGWILPACCSLMVLTFDLLCLRYALIAAGYPPHISLLLAGYGVPLLLGRASFLPGGIAVVEVAMTALYGGLGVPASVAVVAVLTYRLISFWLPALAGIPIAVTLQSPRRA